MNNERAIHLLHRLQDEQFDGIHGDERREALEMAVRALEGDGDMISRQDAIDAILKNQEVYSNNFGNDPIDRYTIAIIDNDVQTIAQLPSAQRKAGKWEVLYPNHKYKYHCSECGANHSAMYDFCPSCGADMRGESE